MYLNIYSTYIVAIWILWKQTLKKQNKFVHDIDFDVRTTFRFLMGDAVCFFMCVYLCVNKFCVYFMEILFLKVYLYATYISSYISTYALKATHLAIIIGEEGKDLYISFVNLFN